MTAPLALTMGDPAGVGPEISIKAWEELRGEVPLCLVGCADHLERTGVPVTRIGTPGESFGAEGLPVLHTALPAQAVPGRPAAENAPATVRFIEVAVGLAQSGAASGVVTNPINKKVLQDGADFPYPGHTEFLAHLGGVERSVMMLAAPELRVVPVTIHIALADVPGALTADLLEETIRITHAALVRDFGLSAPRMAVAGLNPHAGEGGAMGREEIEIIAPLLERLRAEGMVLTGPHSADTMFHPAARAKYDVALCMYHDQALIPLKTIDFSGGVNVTLGLPFVRTSPDHGTAYDIAGQGVADPTSLIAALRMADQLARTRG